MPDDTKNDTETKRREYLKRYQRELRRRMRRVELLFDQADYDRLQRAAQRHHMKMAPFIRASVLAYLNGVYIVPDEERVRQLELGLRRVGTNINQITARMHRAGFDPSVITELHQHLAELEDELTRAFRDPPQREASGGTEP